MDLLFLISLEADAGSSAQPKETPYPYVGVGPRKDKNHNGNSQCSKVLTLYQKNPLSTNKPPCLNIYFKMKIKLKAFVLNAQIPLPFLNPFFLENSSKLCNQTQHCDLKAISFNTDWLLQEFSALQNCERGFFPEEVKGSERYHWFQRRKIFYCICSSFMRQFALLKTAFLTLIF